MTRTSWSLIVSGCALAGLTACTPRTGSSVGDQPSAATPRLVDTTELARVPERTFVNGLWIRRPPVDYVRRSVPHVEERIEPTAPVRQKVEAPSAQPSSTVLPETQAPAAAPPTTSVLPKAEAAPTSRAPLATPTTADLAMAAKPERPLAASEGDGSSVLVEQSAVAVPSGIPQVGQPATTAQLLTTAPVAVPSVPTEAATGPTIEAPVYAWSRRSIDEVAAQYAQQVRSQPWIAQARDHLGRPPRVQIGSIDDGSHGQLGSERFGQSLGIALQAIKGLDLAPGSPPDYQVAGKVSLSDDRHFVQIDLRILDVATKQTLQPFATEVPAVGTGAKTEPGKAGYIP